MNCNQPKETSFRGKKCPVAEVIVMSMFSDRMATNTSNSHQLSLPAPANSIIGQLDSDRNLIDALPYIDKEYEQPGVRDAALALIEEECRRYRLVANRKLFKSWLLSFV